VRLLILQHVPFEGPAAIARWAELRGHSCSYIYCAEHPEYPALNAFDALIIMGGPMGVNDAPPWMSAENEFIRRSIDDKKIVLGVCLGAQLIASALGASVRRNPEKEIGWFTVESVMPDNLASQPFKGTLPASFACLHWHGDTFDIPEGATHLYRSDACENQAFIYDNRVVGLQFHLEFDTATTQRVAEASHDELAAGGRYVQDIDAILSDPERFETANALMFDLLDALIN